MFGQADLLRNTQLRTIQNRALKMFANNFDSYKLHDAEDDRSYLHVLCQVNIIICMHAVTYFHIWKIYINPYYVQTKSITSKTGIPSNAIDLFSVTVCAYCSRKDNCW